MKYGFTREGRNNLGSSEDTAAWPTGQEEAKDKDSGQRAHRNVKVTDRKKREES